MGMMMAHHRIRKALEEKKKAQTVQDNHGIPDDDKTKDFEKMNATELKEYAKANGINISGLTKKDEIKARIIETVNTANNGGNSNPSDDDKAIGSDNGLPDDSDKTDDSAGDRSAKEGTGGDGTVGGTA